MNVCTYTPRILSSVGGMTVLLVVAVFGPIWAAPAESDSVKAEPQEDAESFLPDPVPLSGRFLSVGGVAFSPDGKTLATGNLVGSVKLWNAATGRELASLEGHKDLIFSVSFSRDGKTLSSASKDETAQLWQVPPAEAAADRRASQ